MQLYALEKSLPIAASKAQKGKGYACPECKGEVRIRGGPSRQIHFYHLSAPKHCRQHKKSLEHLQLQLKLLDLIGEEAHIERPFPEIQRIADVAWEARKIVFEVQCSPISLEEAQSRILDYKKINYNVLWILHDKRFNKSQLSSAESFLRENGCYFTNIDKMGQGSVYDQFDVVSQSRRQFKGPPLVVSLEKIAGVPSIAPPDQPLPQAVLNRLSKWQCFARGDLLHRLLQKGNLFLSAKGMIAIEARLKKEKKTARLPLWTLLGRSYVTLLNLSLKRFSHLYKN